MLIQQRGGTLEARLGADLKSAEQFCRSVEEFLEEKAPDVDLFAAMLLVRESVNNAVIHGSRQDPRAAVSVSLEVLADRIVLWVKDQGPGFDWKEALAKEPEPLAENGRGLPILQAYASSFEYSEGGSELTVSLRREQAKESS